jgi:uncharacterized protein YcbK (DUF882 family)
MRCFDLHLRPPMNATPRRRFLLAAGATLPFALSPRAARAAATPRELRFVHLHTGERLVVEYAGARGYVPDALAAVDRLLRDFRTGAVAPIDPTLLDQLHALAQATGTRQPFAIISGYRSPATNEALRGGRAASGVARRSLHLEGRAIDVRLADVPLASLRDAARALGAGGVGYYPGSDFVHLDTGRVRAW